jgi:non-heme chloroperoxidase
LPFSTIKAGLPILSNPFDYASTVKITESQFHFCFGNHTTDAESKKIWERYSIPSVAHVLWQGALASLHPKTSATQVDFEKTNRAPLLLIAGTLDHVIPMSTVEKEYKAYKGPAKVEYKVFEGRSHGIVIQTGWQEVADFALAFAEANLKQ